MKLVNYLKGKSIDIVLIQEHNIKFLDKIEYLLKYYNVILNKSVLLKGGTLILIDRRLPATIRRSYLHPTSRICTVVLDVLGTELYLVNLYAPSGRNKEQEREDLFEQELIYQLIANTDNIVMCGDWNSVLVPKDTTNPANACYSKVLKRILTSFKYKDIYSSYKGKPPYTYYRKNYASRLDRIYLSKLISNIKDINTFPATFSDHLCVCVTLEISKQIQVARPRWRLNVSLLENNMIKNNFYRLWSHLLERKQMFQNSIQWWDLMVKPQISISTLSM